MAAVTPEHLMQLLMGLQQPDTNIIRQAETELKTVLKVPANLETLYGLIRKPEISHMAVTIFRKKFTSYYNTLPDDRKDHWQREILQACIACESRPVRLGLIGVAGNIGLVQGANNKIYLEFLEAAASNARELCYLLISEMSDTIGMHWKPYAQQLLQLLHSGVQPTEPREVQVAAINAMGQLLAFWSDDPDVPVDELVPLYLQAADRFQDEDLIRLVLDTLFDMSYTSSQVLLILQYAVKVVSNAEFSLPVRDSAALVIATCVEAKPKTIGRAQNIVTSILDVLFRLMENSTSSGAGAFFESNPAWQADLDLNVDEGPTETSIAQGTLDLLACEIPTKLFWPIISQYAEARITSNSPNVRKAGVAALGVVAEGCCEAMSEVLPTILPAILQAANDQEPVVRECACFCLGQLSEYCQPEILEYNEQILPAVFRLLDDANVAVQVTSCYVLEMFCERLEPSRVRPMLDSLVRKLTNMLETSNKRSVQEMAVAALAATAVAAETDFSPYFNDIAIKMTHLMNLKDPGLFSLRGRALECMGHMAIAVKKEVFRPHFAATMQSAMEGLTMDSTDLHEFAYAVFANLCKVMKEEFGPAVGDLVPYLVDVIQQEEGTLEPKADEAAIPFVDDDDDDDDDASGKDLVFHVRTALLDVKKGAITALGEMAAHTGGNFCPHLEASMTVLQKAASNWHPFIKAEVAEALPSMILPSVAAHHGGTIDWKTNPNLAPHTVAIVGAVIKLELELAQDDEKSTVAKACDGILTVIVTCGPTALAPILEDTLKLCHSILTKTAPCHAAESLFRDEQPDDDDDHDIVMQGACDLLGGIVKVLGDGFVRYLGDFLPVVCNFAKSSRPPSDRGMAVGCLSEIAQECDISSVWKSVFLPVCLAGLADTDFGTKRNAAFCMGVCCERLKGSVAADMPAILSALSPLFGLPASRTDAAACVDNAAAAVARIIMHCGIPDQSVISAFLSALPLKTDMSENETVYECLFGLVQQNHPGLHVELSRIVSVAVGNEEIDEEIRKKLHALN